MDVSSREPASAGSPWPAAPARVTVRVLERAPRCGPAAPPSPSSATARPPRPGSVPRSTASAAGSTAAVRPPTAGPWSTADLRVLARRTGFAVTSVPRDRLIAHLAEGLPAGVRRRGVVDVDGRPTAYRRSTPPARARGRRRGRRRRLPVGGASRDPRRRPGRRERVDDLAGPHAGAARAGRRHPARASSAPPGSRPHAAGDGLLMWWFDVPEPLPGSPVADSGRRFAGYGGPWTSCSPGRDARRRAVPHVLTASRTGGGEARRRCSATPRTRSRPLRRRAPTRRSKTRGCCSRALRTDPVDVPAALRRYESLRGPPGAQGLRPRRDRRTNKPLPPLARTLTRPDPAGAIGPAYVAQLRG